MQVGDLVWSRYHELYGVIVEVYNSPVSVYDGWRVAYVDAKADNGILYENEVEYELEVMCK